MNFRRFALASLFALCAGSMFSRAAETLPAEVAGLKLTAEEAAWLKAHPVLRLGLDPKWPPFSFEDGKGGVHGIDLDYLDIIGKALGVRFEVVKTALWEETNERMLKGEFDVISGISPTGERARVLVFTAPYVRFPTAVINRLDGPFATDLAFVESCRIAAPRGYVTTAGLKEAYPRFDFVETDTLSQALRLVSKGEADYVVENLASVSYLIREDGLTNLKIAGLGEFQFELRFGVRRDLPLLYSAMDKALAAVSPQQRAKILAEWVYIPRDHPGPFRRYAKWLAAAAALALLGVAGFWWRNRRLAAELLERRRIEGELRRLSAEKNHFMTMAAHDINNPLTVISMSCQLALGGREDDPGGELSGYYHIQKHARRISQLIASLLNPEAIENRQSDPGLRATDLPVVLRRVMDGCAFSAARKDIAIRAAGVPEELPAILADPDAVMQVLENLISNAVKFSPRGGWVEVAARIDGDRARVEITDSGPGISEDDRGRLFSRFARLSAHPTGEESSHGVGLFIVRELMERMGGTVRAAEGSGPGATFVVEFRLAGGRR